MDYFVKNGRLYKVTISSDVMSKFKDYEWPGNVKQLKNTLEGLLISAKTQGKIAITIDMLPLYMLNKEKAKDIEFDT